MEELKFLDHVHFDNIPLGLQGKERNPYLRAIAPLVHFPFVPTFGVSMNESDALSVLADAQYVYVRHFNSGSRNYGASDLFQYELATISVYLLYAIGRKALGISKLFDKHNRVLGKALALANHIDVEDIRANSQDFTKWLNLFKEKLATYVIPGDIAILPRWFSLTEGIIADDYTEGQTKQLYDFSPSMLYQYDWEHATLVPVDYINDYCSGNDNLLNFESFRNLATDLLSQLQNSDDVGTISGDLLKAYGDNVYKLVDTPEDYISPICRATNELLAFIKNADLIINPFELGGSPVSSGTSWEYTQVDTIIRFNPIVGVGTIKYDSYKNSGSATPEAYSLLTDIEEADLRNVVNGCYNAVFTGKRVVDFLSDAPDDKEKAAALLGKFTLQTDQYGKLVESFNNNIELSTGSSINSGKNVRFYALQRCGSEVMCMPHLFIVDTDNTIDEIYAMDFMNVFQIVHMSGSGSAVSTPYDLYHQFLNHYNDKISNMAYCNQFDCIPHYFLGCLEAVSKSGLRISLSYPGTQNTIASKNGFIHNETHNVKYIPTSTIEYALESYCWDNLVNDLWLKRK